MEKEVRDEDLKTKCRWSPYRGRVLKGWPAMTIASGKVLKMQTRGRTYKYSDVDIVYNKILPKANKQFIPIKDIFGTTLGANVKKVGGVKLYHMHF